MGRHIVRDLRTALLVADKNGNVNTKTICKKGTKAVAKKTIKTEETS